MSGNRVLLCAVLLTGIRLYLLYISNYNLYADEAQYWSWSLKLAAGYYSKPPVIAWLIALTTSLCGDSEFCIRLSSPIIHLLISTAVFGIAKELYNPVIAGRAMLAYLTLPAVTLSATLISTDPSLLLCWSVSLYCFVKAVKSGALWWWATAGLAAGIGMLSKYNMVFFFPSALFYLLFSTTTRPHLYRPGFWCAALLALLIYAPNIAWNYQYGFVSYLHTKQISNLHKDLFHPEKLAEFLGMQLAVFGPVFFVVLAIAVFRVRTEASRLLLWFALPLLAGITLLSLLSKAEGNWAAPSYITATIIVTALLYERKQTRLFYGAIGLHMMVAAVFYYYEPIMQGLNLSVAAKMDPHYRLKGWKQLGEKVEALAVSYPQAGVLFDERKTMAEMLYYAKAHKDRFYKWNVNTVIEDHYDLTRDSNIAKENSFLYIGSHLSTREMVGRFRYIKRLENIIIPVYPDYSLYYRVYYLERRPRELRGILTR